jgi:hypothetical protein
MRVFVAGATGVIDGPLVKQLPAAGGPMAAATMTIQRGASSAKARPELGWSPAYPTWRDDLLGTAGT